MPREHVNQRHAYRDGAVAGVIAGTVMSMAMMTIALLRGESVWALPNLIAALWFGPGVAVGSFDFPTERAPMMQMTWGHLIFGAVFAMAYHWLTRRAERH